MVWISSQTGQKSQSKVLDIRSDWAEVPIQLYGYPVRLDRRPDPMVWISSQIGQKTLSGWAGPPVHFIWIFFPQCVGPDPSREHKQSTVHERVIIRSYFITCAYDHSIVRPSIQFRREHWNGRFSQRPGNLYNYKNALESLGYPSESSWGRWLFISIAGSRRVVVSAGVMVERCLPDIASCVLRNNLQHMIGSTTSPKVIPWLVGVSDGV